MPDKFEVGDVVHWSKAALDKGAPGIRSRYLTIEAGPFKVIKVTGDKIALATLEGGRPLRSDVDTNFMFYGPANFVVDKFFRAVRRVKQDAGK